MDVVKSCELGSYIPKAYTNNYSLACEIMGLLQSKNGGHHNVETVTVIDDRDYWLKKLNLEG